MMGHVAIFTPELSWYKRITNGGSDSKGEEFGNKITDLQRFQEVQNNQVKDCIFPQRKMLNLYMLFNLYLPE